MSTEGCGQDTRAVVKVDMRAESKRERERVRARAMAIDILKIVFKYSIHSHFFVLNFFSTERERRKETDRAVESDIMKTVMLCKQNLVIL